MTVVNLDYPRWISSSLILNVDERLIEESAVSIDEKAGAYGSCSTMLNGEAIIFGGYSDLDIIRQVHVKITLHKLEIAPTSDFGGF